MKRSTSLLLLMLASMAASAPRVGQHDGYTRLAFDLPADASASITPTAGGVTVWLDQPLKRETGEVQSDDISRWSVIPDGQRSRINLSLTAGRKAKVFVLPAANGTPARLVVDTGTTVDGVAPTGQQASLAGIVKAASTQAPARPKLRVVLDPGHGGIDPGMVGYVTEKEVTLDVTLRVRDLLLKRGVEVTLTRDRDTQLSRDKTTDLLARAQMANAGTVNAFVSVHVNAATNRSAQGIETWVFGQPIDAKTRALAVRENGGGDLGERLTREASNVAQGLLGDLLSSSNMTYSRKLAQLVQGQMVSATGAVNRGVDAAPFAVIRYPRTPAILIELGFGSHAVEGKKLAQDDYRQKLAVAIADGIGAFLNVR